VTYEPERYPDPSARHRQRYWDGRTWTDQVVGTDPEPGATTVAAEGDPGWRPDPSGRFHLRYWDCTTWTDQVTFVDPVWRTGAGAPPAEPARAVEPALTTSRPSSATRMREVEHLRYTRGFLDDAHRYGTLSDPAHLRLLRLVDDRMQRLQTAAVTTRLALVVPSRK
jgi:hypothetical protein